MGCALAQKACRDGFSVLHKRTSELFRELAVAHADGSIGRLLVRLSRIDVLLLDYFAMAPVKDTERRDFLEICDDRYQRRSLIPTSQMPLAHWHEQIGDPTVADSTLDRLVHNAHRIEQEKPQAGRGGPTSEYRIRTTRPLSLHLHVPERSSPARAHSGHSFQTQKRFSSAALKPRALAGCGPF